MPGFGWAFFYNMELTQRDLDFLDQINRSGKIEGDQLQTMKEIGQKINPSFNFCMVCPPSISNAWERLKAFAKEQRKDYTKPNVPSLPIQVNVSYVAKFFDGLNIEDIRGKVCLYKGVIMETVTDDRDLMLYRALNIMNDRDEFYNISK